MRYSDIRTIIVESGYYKITLNDNDTNFYPGTETMYVGVSSSSLTYYAKKLLKDSATAKRITYQDPFKNYIFASAIEKVEKITTVSELLKGINQ